MGGQGLLRRRVATFCAALEAWCIYVWFDVLLRFRGFHVAWHAANPARLMDLPEDQKGWHAARAVHGLQLAARLYRPRGYRCLLRSLVLHRMLITRRVPARLVIGVCPESPPNSSRWAFHAWVETSLGPIAETDTVRDDYVVLVEDMATKISGDY